MRREIPAWVILLWMVLILWRLSETCGWWVWLLCGLLVAAVLAYDLFRARQIRLAPCRHGVAGANVNRELCGQCKAESEEKRKADEESRKAEEEKRRLERESEYRQYLQKIRLPVFLQEMDPQEFERLACDLHARMGYVVEATPYSGDHGADGLLKRDGELTVLQAKRVQGSVGEPVLRDLFGTMHSLNARHGVVVTTGKVSVAARKWVENKPIRIIELEELASLIRRYFPEDEVVPDTFVVPGNKSNVCPKCYRSLRRMTGSHGHFFGCTGYPTCRYTRSVR